MPTTDVDIQIHSVVSMNSNIEKDTRGKRSISCLFLLASRRASFLLFAVIYKPLSRMLGGT
eukprot:scaffold907_cov198-Chaetoceros_neogracile.AAC.9